jgi:hypothetical protein
MGARGRGGEGGREGAGEEAMSDTPRTDEACSDGWSGDAICVSADFARELERENATLMKRLNWARSNCRIVYLPPGEAYPVEHAPHAGKDGWHALAAAADTA